MRNKRDLYLDFNHGNNRKRRKSYKVKRGINRKLWYTIIVILLAIVLGYSTYYISKESLSQRDHTLKVQEKLRVTGSEDPYYNSDNLQTKESENNDINTPSDDLASIENQQQGNNDIEGIPNQSNNIDDKVIKEGVTTDVSIVDDLTEEFMPDFIDTRTPVKVKGIYVTGPRAGSDIYMKELIQLVETTELNAMVIDIKNDSGEITYKMDQPLVQEIKAGINYIPNIKELITELKEKNIYLIARVVAFKDPILADNKPEYSLKKKDGTIFKDKDGHSWVNPYKKEVWDYLISVSKEAVELGFDEIQFDYIRFSTDSGMKEIDFGHDAKNISKMDIIAEFTKYASEQLKPLGVFVSADVYGTIIDSKVDAEIVGQSYVEMSKYLDYICPMIYPSHYVDGAYGIEHPDLEPYELILSALNKSNTVLKEIDDNKNKAKVRGWLQDFTAKWIRNYQSYGPEEIRAQIQAVYDAGYEEWILWNGNTNYTKEGLLTD
jgi:hypothetical protein